MCSSAKCSQCGKTSFVGCGQHLDSLFKYVKTEDLCKCNPKIRQWIKKNRGKK